MDFDTSNQTDGTSANRGEQVVVVGVVGLNPPGPMSQLFSPVALVNASGRRPLRIRPGPVRTEETLWTASGSLSACESPSGSKSG